MDPKRDEWKTPGALPPPIQLGYKLSEDRDPCIAQNPEFNKHQIFHKINELFPSKCDVST